APRRRTRTPAPPPRAGGRLPTGAPPPPAGRTAVPARFASAAAALTPAAAAAHHRQLAHREVDERLGVGWLRGLHDRADHAVRHLVRWGHRDVREACGLEARPELRE